MGGGLGECVEWEGREGRERKALMLVSRLRPGCPLSAELVLGVVLVQQFDVCEGKVATFAFTFALPLAVHVDFGHLHHIAHLGREGREERCERVQQRLSHYLTRFIVVIKNDKNTDISSQMHCCHEN